MGAATQPPNTAPASAFPDDLTVPQDIPHFTVSPSSPAIADEGDIFVAPFPWTKAVTGDYLLILDGQGQLIYYQSMAAALNAYDFKVQPNGLLSYYSQKDAAYYVFDSHYQVVDKIQMGNGYTADLHDLQLLPNGNALLMGYDAETVDMSKIVPGGKEAATVTGLIIRHTCGPRPLNASDQVRPSAVACIRSVGRSQALQLNRNPVSLPDEKECEKCRHYIRTCLEQPE